MEKIEAVYEGFIFLGISFVAVATFLYVCLLGYCNQTWTSFNEIFCLFAEIMVFIWMIIHVNRGANEVYKESDSLRAVAHLFRKIRVLTVYAMGYSVIQLFLPEMDIHLALIYGANIFFVASFFFVWMSMRINDIEKHRRFWRCATIKEKGYWNRNNLFLNVRFFSFYWIMLLISEFSLFSWDWYQSSGTSSSESLIHSSSSPHHS